MTEYSTERDRWEVMISLEKAFCGSGVSGLGSRDVIGFFEKGFRVQGSGFLWRRRSCFRSLCTGFKFYMGSMISLEITQ